MDTTTSVRNPLLRVLFGVIAFIAVPIYQGGKYLSQKTYDGFLGWLLGFFLGLPASVAGGIYVAGKVSWHTPAGVDSWFASWLPRLVYDAGAPVAHFVWPVVTIVAGFLGFLAVLTYAWPVLFLVAIKPLAKLSREIRRCVDDYASRNFKSNEDSFLGVVKSVFKPDLWSAVQEKERDRSWVSGAISGVSYMSIVAGVCYGSYVILTGAHAALAAYIGLAAWVVGALPALFVLFTFIPVLGNFIEYARLGFSSVVAGLSATYALAPFTKAVVAHMGYGSGLVYGLYVVEAVAVVAYIFPAVYLLLSGGLMKKIADAVEKLLDTVVDEPQNDFRRFFHQAVTLATVWRFATLSLLLWAMLGVSGGYSLALAVAVGALTYILVGELLDNSAGNIIIGLVASAHAGIFSGLAYANHGLVFGAYGAIVAGVIAAALTFCVVYPVVYRGVRFVSNLIRLSLLGQPLGKLHDKVWDRFEKVMRKFERVYERGYWDDRQQNLEGDYRKMFLHVINLASPVAGFVGGAALAQLLGFGTVLTLATAIVAAALAYLLIGQLLLVSSSGGTHLVGSVLAIGGGVTVGQHAMTAQAHGLYVAIPLGAAVAALVYCLVFPALYIGLRFLTQSWTVGWLYPLLSGIYNAAWKVFDTVIWQPFLVVYRAVRDNIFKPLWKLFVRFWAAVWAIWLSIWNGIKDAWDGMFGHKRV